MNTLVDGALWETLREAVINTRLLKVRGVMALIGIAIGTAAVIAMLHIGYNARSAALQQFEAMGTDLINILPGTMPNGFEHVDERYLANLASDYLSLAEVSAIMRGNAVVHTSGADISASGFAVADSFFSILKAKFEEGRSFSQFDGDAPYIILGSEIAESISSSNSYRVAPGDQVQVGGKVLTVIGIMSPIPPNLIFRIDLNNAVLVPFKGARHLGTIKSVSAVLVRFSATGNLPEVIELLQQKFGAAVNIQTAQQLIAGLDEQMRIYSSLLLAIGGVSLVVGGVGIMNVMLMNVVERRQEVGLRQALGARPKDIRNMFLVEALIVSGAGSAIGIILGFLTAWVFAYVSEWEFNPSPYALPLGGLMAIIVGLFFGSYPAVRASKMHPVAALRSL